MGIVKRRSRKEPRLEIQLESSVRAWLREIADIVVDQFQVPWGIVDLFAIRSDIDRVLLRRDLAQLVASTSDQEVMVLLSVPEQSSGDYTNESLLVERFAFLLGEKKVRTIIATLRRRKYIKSDDSGAIVRFTPWLPYHVQMWSIELKLQRVEEALAQAKRHLKITPLSYVGLPQSVAERTASSDKARVFREAGVGLLSITESNCTTLIEPRADVSCVDPVYAVAAAERCWGIYLKTVNH